MMNVQQNVMYTALAAQIRKKKDIDHKILQALEPDFQVTDDWAIETPFQNVTDLPQAVYDHCVNKNILAGNQLRIKELHQFFTPKHLKNPESYFQALQTLRNVKPYDVINALGEVGRGIRLLRNYNCNGPKFKLHEKYQLLSTRRLGPYMLGKNVDIKQAITDLKRIGDWYRLNEKTLDDICTLEEEHINKIEKIRLASHTKDTQK